MEILALAFLWPVLIFVVGFVFISSWSVSGGFLLMPAILLFVILIFGVKNRLGEIGVTQDLKDLDRMRRGIAAFSIALLLPIFVKYLLAVSGNNLSTVILGLVLGFGVVIWGMFMKRNKVLTYASLMGGAFVIIYLYGQLWTLGEFAQIVATAFGLAVAVAISVVKFREKLL